MVDSKDVELLESLLNSQGVVRREQPASKAVSLPLSPRELLVSRLFAEGHSSSEIGLVLGLTPETVRAYLRTVRSKFKNDGRPATDRLQLRARLIADGLLDEWG
jgi:DNA-binding CsgD family transcriptional regulator